MIGLVDCNNFFVSCERTLRPELNNKAVVVLSNNDGCAIARSNEAKAMGIKMGQPAFELRNLIKSGKLIALSGNHLLYHDISVAVHNIFKRYSPSTIDYSIDEAFLNMSGVPQLALTEIGMAIYRACMDEEQIPVTIGFAPSKTLAKVATYIGKKNNQPVFIITNDNDITTALQNLPIGDLWGVGRRLAQRMYFDGIHTAAHFASKSLSVIKNKYGINGERTWLELHGTDCIQLNAEKPKIQNSISETRTFAEDITNYDFIQSRIVMFANHCASSLRKMQAGCKSVSVILRTNRFRINIPQQYLTIQIDMQNPISSSTLIAQTAAEGLKRIYNPTLAYKRAGVVLAGICSLKTRQMSLFENEQDLLQNDIKQTPLMNAIDKLNNTLTKPVLRPASQMGIGTPPKQDGFSSSFGFKQ